MKQRGFTLIELMIVVCILMVFGSIIMGAVGSTSGSTVSYGVNGVTEMRCIDGFKFIVGNRGDSRQVMDEFGKGVRCSNFTKETK